MEKYPTYKQSGIKWISEIPEHWETLRAKNMFTKEKRSIREEDDVITCFRDGQVTLRKNRRTTGFTESITEVGYQGIRKGDLVIHQMDAFAGAIGVSDSDGKGTSVYHCCTPKGKYNTTYFAYLIRIMAYSGYIQSLYRGIRERSSDFNFNIFGRQYLSVPPYLEQLSIVAFLEKATANIDAYIKQTEQEINTLNELKQAEIAEVVTKGLNPDAPMKDSGIAWIGQIPEYWGCLAFKAVFTMKSITNRIEEELLSVYLDKGVIKFSDVETKRTNTTSQDLSKYQLVEKGDFVLNNQQAWRGSVGVSMYKGIVSPAYIILSLSNKFNIKYANYLLRDKSMVTNYFLTSRGVGTIQRNLYWNELKRKKILIPPIKEQQQIVDYIESKTSKIEEYITTLKSEIAQMQEYKQRLISDVVTGKIKVME